MEKKKVKNLNDVILRFLKSFLLFSGRRGGGGDNVYVRLKILRLGKSNKIVQPAVNHHRCA